MYWLLCVCLCAADRDDVIVRQLHSHSVVCIVMPILNLNVVIKIIPYNQ